MQQQQQQQQQQLQQQERDMIRAVNESLHMIPDILKPGFRPLTKLLKRSITTFQSIPQMSIAERISSAHVLFSIKKQTPFNFSSVVLVLSNSPEDVPNMLRKVCQYLAKRLFNMISNQTSRQLFQFQVDGKKESFPISTLNDLFLWDLQCLVYQIMKIRLHADWIVDSSQYSVTIPGQWKLSIIDRPDCYCESATHNMHHAKKDGSDHTKVRGKFKIDGVEYDLLIDQQPRSKYVSEQVVYNPGISIFMKNPEYQQQSKKRQQKQFQIGEGIVYLDGGMQFQGTISKKQESKLYATFDDGETQQQIKKQNIGGPLPPKQIRKIHIPIADLQKDRNSIILIVLNVFRGIYIIKAMLDQNSVEMTESVKAVNEHFNTELKGIIDELRPIAASQQQTSKA